MSDKRFRVTVHDVDTIVFESELNEIRDDGWLLYQMMPTQSQVNEDGDIRLDQDGYRMVRVHCVWYRVPPGPGLVHVPLGFNLV